MEFAPKSMDCRRRPEFSAGVLGDANARLGGRFRLALRRSLRLPWKTVVFRRITFGITPWRRRLGSPGGECTSTSGLLRDLFFPSVFRLSEVPFLLRRCPRRGECRNFGGLTGPFQVVTNRGRIGDRGYDFHPASALRASHFDLKNSGQQSGPRQPVFTGRDLFFVFRPLFGLSSGYDLFSVFCVWR